MDSIKAIFNFAANPRLYFFLMISALVLLVWKREKITSNAFGIGALVVFGLFFGLGGLDPNFRLIITKPDNVPIVGLIFLLVFFVWYSMKEAVLFIILFAVLVVRPQGLFSRADAQRD